jgi:hypothetical protein
LGATTEEENMSAKRPGEPLNVFYSIKLTKSQRVKLLQLGGPEWIRQQIDKAKNGKRTESI